MLSPDLQLTLFCLRLHVWIPSGGWGFGKALTHSTYDCNVLNKILTILTIIKAILFHVLEHYINNSVYFHDLA